MKRTGLGMCLLLIAVAVMAGPVRAQTTEFTYQGSLQNSSAPASGNFDFEFLLFDSLAGGVQQGATLTRSTVAVAAGTFAVKLDFGSQFPGANRFLEIRVRTAGGGAFTPLTPRQPVSSSPYSVQSLNAANATNAVNATTAANATQLGGIAANQYVVTTDPRMSDERTPAAGGSNYIQNGTSAQASSNFNISGTGTANILNAATQFNIGGNRVMRAANGGVFAGFAAGANTTGAYNAFFGDFAGTSNTTGAQNSYYGVDAGRNNQTGSGNSFFGNGAGFDSTGNNNSIFGSKVGTLGARTGDFNSFFGHRAGEVTNGSLNSFFGTGSGIGNVAGNSNVFVGHNSGSANTLGSFNTIVGENADLAAGNLTNATAIGSKSFVSQSNSLVLGSINGVNLATADTNVGIGTSAPGFRLHVVGKNFRLENNSFPTFSLNFTGGALDAKKWQNYATTNQLVFSALNDAETFDTDWLRVNRGSGIAVSSVVMPNGNVGIGATAPNAKLQVAGGSVYIQQPNSLILTSPNGACWFITVNNAGGLATISVPCP